MSDFSINFINLNWWLLIIIALILAVFYFAVYGIYKNKTGLLITTRIAFFIILILLIMKPVVSWKRARKLEPEFLLFLDNSLSLKEQDGYSRSKILNSIENLEAQLEQKDIKVNYHIFDQDIRSITSFREFTNTGQKTDLSNIFEYKKDLEKNRNVAGALILTDGVITEGQTLASIKDPGRAPVFTSGPGDTLAALDAAVVNLELSDNARVGDTVKVTAEVNPASNNEWIKTVLNVNDKEVASKNIQTVQTYQRRPLEFSYVPEKPGEKKVSLQIKDENDKNIYNNSLERRLRVRSRFLNYVIIGSKFDFDGKFLNHVFAIDKEVNCYQMVAYKDRWVGNHDQAKIFNLNWDLVILNGFPAKATNNKLLQELKSKLGQHNSPLLILVDSRVDNEKLRNLLNIDIFAERKLSQKQAGVQVIVNRDWQNHPVNLYLEGTIGGQWWQELPPINYPFEKVNLDQKFDKLIYTMDVNENPILSVASFDGENRRRIALLTGTAFWKWHMMTIGSESEDTYAEMLFAVTDYLRDTTARSPIQIYPGKEEYRLGESIELQGRITNVRDQSINNAVVQAAIYREDEKYKTFFIPRQGRGYETEFSVNQPGNYEVKLSAQQAGIAIDSVSRIFSVIDQPIELETVKLNKKALTQIAKRSGGNYFNLDEIGRISREVKNSSERVVIERKIKLWQWEYILIILLGIFLTELIYRKTRGFL
jgi:hypothetical protein